MPIVLKSGSLKLLEPSGSVQDCNEIALPFVTQTRTGRLKEICSASLSSLSILGILSVTKRSEEKEAEEAPKLKLKFN